MKPKLSERHVQGQILNWLERKGIFHYRQNTGGAKLKGFYVKFGKKGAPDIVAICEGRYVAIEVKREGGKQSAAQIEYMNNVIVAGGLYILADRLEDVTQLLES